MREALILTLALAGCAATPKPAPEPGCDADAAQAVIGETASPAVGEKARALSRAASVRVLEPGTIVTMEYRGDRLNLDVDGSGKITRVRCG